MIRFAFLLKGDITRHKTKLLKLDPITACVKTYANVKNNFDLSFFGLNIVQQLNFESAYLIKCYCQKPVVHLKGYTTVVLT